MRILRNLLHRPSIRMGFMSEKKHRRTSLRSAEFVSFFSASEDSRHRYTDQHDLRLRRQRRWKAFVTLAVVAGCTWFVIESAQALSIF